MLISKSYQKTMSSFLHQRKTSFEANIISTYDPSNDIKQQNSKIPHSQCIINSKQHQSLYTHINFQNSHFLISNNNDKSHRQYKSKKNKYNRKPQTNSCYKFSHGNVRALSSTRDFTYKVSQLMQIDIGSALLLTKKCIMEYVCFSKDKQFPKFDLSCWSVDMNGKVVYNRRINRLYVKTGQKEIIQDILQSISSVSNSSFQDFMKYFERISKNRNVNFKYMLSLIASYISCSKIKQNNRIQLNFLHHNSPVSTQNNSHSKPYHRDFYSDEKISLNRKIVNPTKLFMINEDSSKKTPKFLLEISKKQRINKKKVKNQINCQYNHKYDPSYNKTCKTSTTSTKLSEQQNKSILSISSSKLQASRADHLWKKLECIQKHSHQVQPVLQKDLKGELQRSFLVFKFDCFPENVHQVQSQGTMSENELQRSYVVYSNPFEDQQINSKTHNNKMQNQREFWKKKINRLITDEDEDNEIKVSVLVSEGYTSQSMHK